MNPQALREELQRRRGSSVGSGGTVEDAERIKSLEEELERWVCSLFRFYTLQPSHISLRPLAGLSKRLLAQEHSFFSRRGLRCFFFPRSCHVEQFTFHISLPSLKFIIFVHLTRSLISLFWRKTIDIATVNITKMMNRHSKLNYFTWV